MHLLSTDTVFQRLVQSLDLGPPEKEGYIPYDHTLESFIFSVLMVFKVCCVVMPFCFACWSQFEVFVVVIVCQHI